MKSFRKQYLELDVNLSKRFDELVEGKTINLIQSNLNIKDKSILDEILNLIDEDRFCDAVSEYQINEYFDEIYYNDSNGNERMCNFLGVNCYGELYVYDTLINQTKHIRFSDLNLLLSKITIIEEIEKTI